jgi:hypothetical protein
MSVEIQTHQNEIGKKAVIKNPNGIYTASIIFHNGADFLLGIDRKREIALKVEEMIEQFMAEDVADSGQF